MKRFKGTLPAHLFIEMFYNRKNKNQLLQEDKLSSRNFNLLCEEFGVFKGCFELAQQIYEKIEENLSNGVRLFDFYPKDCDFIKGIEITLQNSMSSSYQPDSSKIRTINKYVKNEDGQISLKEEDYFYPLTLIIGIKTDKETTITAIMHELTHAYEDFKRRTEGAMNLHQKAYNIGYQKNPVHPDSSGYDHELEYMVSIVMYYTSDFEVNAFIAAMVGHMRHCDIEFENITECMRWLNNIMLYGNFRQIIKWMDLLIALDNENDFQSFLTKQLILFFANNRSSNDFKTYRQFTKWVKKKRNEIEYRLDTVIPKAAAKYMKIKNTTIKPNDLIQQ